MSEAIEQQRKQPYPCLSSRIIDVIPQPRNLYLVFDFMATDLQKLILSNRRHGHGIDKTLAKARDIFVLFL